MVKKVLVFILVMVVVLAGHYSLSQAMQAKRLPSWLPYVSTLVLAGLVFSPLRNEPRPYVVASIEPAVVLQANARGNIQGRTHVRELADGDWLYIGDTRVAKVQRLDIIFVAPLKEGGAGPGSLY